MKIALLQCELRNKNVSLGLSIVCTLQNYLWLTSLYYIAGVAKRNWKWKACTGIGIDPKAIKHC